MLDGDLFAKVIEMSARKNGTTLERRLTELEKAEICQRIKDARLLAGMTQEELADILHVGVRTVANYESTRVPFRFLDRIADALGVSQEWLLRGAEASPAQLGELEARLETVEGLAREILGLLRQDDRG